MTYDALDRLDLHKINGTTVLDMDYQSDGNIDYKTYLGTYTYGASAGPHAVTGTAGATYQYDANGNMINRDGDAITWYADNLPKKIHYGSDSAEFWYGPDRGRYKQVAISGGSTVTTRYVGDHFEVETRGSLTISRHWIVAGGERVALYERRSDGTFLIRYPHRDHQGNIVTTASQKWEYEPFGMRSRTIGSGADDTERGYTGHEHLESVALIHMNGRVQDPVLGRFVSADPLVQAPYHSQSLNRYSYVWNNPVSFVDPSGFEVVGDCDATFENNGRRSCQDVFVNAEAWSAWAWVHSPAPVSDLSTEWWLCAQGGACPHVEPQGQAQSGGFSPTSWRTDFFVFNPIGQTIARPFDLLAPFWLVEGYQVNPVSGEFLSMERQQEAAVLSFAAGGFGALRGALARGSATVIEHAGSHASVLVRSGNTVLHTEQIVGAGGQTTIAVVENAAPAVRSLTVSLPDAAAAMRYQQSVLGQATGTYNAATNSCVTHCGDVLRAGGLEAPSTTRRIVTWLRGLGGD